MKWVLAMYKILTVKGRYINTFHERIPLRYQIRSTLVLPLPSTLAGAFARAVLEYFNIGSLRLRPSGRKVKLQSPSFLLQKMILASYIKVNEAKPLTIGNLLLEHIMASAGKGKKPTNVMGREYVFGDYTVTIVYVIDVPFRIQIPVSGRKIEIDETLVKRALYRIRFIGSAESFFEVEDVKILDTVDTLLENGTDNGETGYCIHGTAIDIKKIEGEYQLYLISDIASAMYPCWQEPKKSSMPYKYIVPGRIERFFEPGTIKIKAAHGWSLINVEGDFIPVLSGELG